MVQGLSYQCMWCLVFHRSVVENCPHLKRTTIDSQRVSWIIDLPLQQLDVPIVGLNQKWLYSISIAHCYVSIITTKVILSQSYVTSANVVYYV